MTIAAFDHGLGQLLDEQRHAISAIHDLVRDLVGQRFAASDVADHFGPLLGRQSIEIENRYVWVPQPTWRELRPESDNQQNPQSGHPIDQQVERLQRRWVTPVDILEHHQHRYWKTWWFTTSHLKAAQLF
jgi:hypothetical protein